MNNETSTPEKDAPKKGGILSAVVFGIILALLIFIPPGIFAITSGFFDGYIMERYLPQFIEYPLPDASLAIPSQQNDAVDIYYLKAGMLTNSGDYQTSIAYLDSLLQISPKDARAYGLRARNYYWLNNNQNSLSAYMTNLQNALMDTDMAISLNPAEAELYALRRDILADLANQLPYQTDRETVLNAAIENDKRFLEISPSEDRKLRVEAVMAEDLANVGRCAEGANIVLRLQKKITTPTSGQYGCLLCASAAASACLGDLDDAIQSLDQLPPTATRAYLKGLHQYQAGKKDDALKTLNASIDAEPTYGGARYLLRALIYLEKGEREQAIQDLRMGERYSWERDELYAYVNGKLALEDGNQAEALRWLQIAEASLFPYANVLKKQIQNELQQLGAEPLAPQATIDFKATPMPPLAP